MVPGRPPGPRGPVTPGSDPRPYRAWRQVPGIGRLTSSDPEPRSGSRRSHSSSDKCQRNEGHRSRWSAAHSQPSGQKGCRPREAPRRYGARFTATCSFNIVKFNSPHSEAQCSKGN